VNDYPQVREIWQESFTLHSTDSLENFKEFIRRNPGLSFVEEYENKVIAVALGSYNGRIGYICRLAVKKEFRNKGIAARLNKAVEAALEKIKAKQVFLYCHQNLAKFYLDLGYRTEDDCVVMIKDL